MEFDVLSLLKSHTYYILSVFLFICFEMLCCHILSKFIYSKMIQIRAQFNVIHLLLIAPSPLSFRQPKQKF